MPQQTHNIIKLHFTSPLHLSSGKQDTYDVSEEVLHSDTIKSAIFVCAKQLFGDGIGESFFDGFQVSSAFPFQGDELFFPKPMLKLEINLEGESEEEISKKSKRLKKLKYLSLPIFEQVIAGKPIQVSEKQFSADKSFLFSSKKEHKVIYDSQVNQRLATAKGDEKDGTPYYVDRIHFSKDSGLYFFLDCKEEYKTKVQAAIKLLGDNGIGTDRTVGNGQFEIKDENSNIKITFPENANAKILLSLYCPREEELKIEFLQQSAYLLVKRGGYIASPEDLNFMTYRKKSIYMFAEAAVFPAEMKVRGKKEDLRPDGVNHPVWRDGTAFTIPVIKKQKDA